MFLGAAAARFVHAYTAWPGLGTLFWLVMVMSVEYRTEVCSKLYIGF